MNALLLLALVASPVNDTAFTAQSGTGKPMKTNPHIRMVSEVVKANLPSCEVECTFVFKNEGRATSVTIGFPEFSYGPEPMKKGKQTRFASFKSWVDGKPVRVQRVVEVMTEEDGERFWWTKKVDFRAGQTLTVVNRYSTEPGTQVGMRPNTLRRFLSYIVSTGAAWKGKIGSGRFEVDLGSIAGRLEKEGTTPGYKKVGRKLIWEWKNYEPTENHNLFVFWYEPVK